MDSIRLVSLIIAVLWRLSFASDSYYFIADDNRINYTCNGLIGQGWTAVGNICVSASSPNITTWSAASDACAESASVPLSLLGWLSGRLLTAFLLPQNGSFWTAYRTENTSALATIQGRLTSMYNPLWRPLEPPRDRNASTWCVAYEIDRSASASSATGGWRLESCAAQLLPLCQTFACRDDEFRCGDRTRCIPRSAVRDGVVDCADGSDEAAAESRLENSFDETRRDDRSAAYICPLPRDLRRVRIRSVGGYNSGDVIEYECNDGFTSPYVDTADMADEEQLLLRSVCVGTTREWTPPVSCGTKCKCEKEPQYLDLERVVNGSNLHGGRAEFSIPGHEHDDEWRVIAFCDARRCAKDGTGGRWIFFNVKLLDLARRCYLPTGNYVVWNDEYVNANETANFTCMQNTRPTALFAPFCFPNGTLSELPNCSFWMPQDPCIHGQLAWRVPKYTCACEVGFRFNGVTCIDIDECAENLAICDPLSTCMNLEGNYTCVCGEGRCSYAENTGSSARSECPCPVVYNIVNPDIYDKLCYTCRCGKADLQKLLTASLLPGSPAAVIVPQATLYIGRVDVYWKPADVMIRYTARCERQQWKLLEHLLCNTALQRGWTASRVVYAPFERMELNCTLVDGDRPPVDVVAMCGREGDPVSLLPACSPEPEPPDACQKLGCIRSSTAKCEDVGLAKCECIEGFYGDFCEFEDRRECGPQFVMQATNAPRSTMSPPPERSSRHTTEMPATLRPATLHTSTWPLFTSRSTRLLAGSIGTVSPLQHCTEAGEVCTMLSTPDDVEHAISAGCGCVKNAAPRPGDDQQLCHATFDACDDRCEGKRCITQQFPGQEYLGFNCFCESGRLGEFCDVTLDDCQNAYAHATYIDAYRNYYCVDGSRCFVNGNDSLEPFRCDCLSGFTGVLCEEVILCDENIHCSGHGECMPIGPGSWECICKQGWTGKDCGTSIDDCRLYEDFCLNGGRCRTEDGKCECLENTWNGIRCSKPFEEYRHSGCDCEFGSCAFTKDEGESEATLRCFCEENYKDYYKGERCDEKIRHCAFSPCFPAGGKCVNDTAESYACECGQSFTGAMCEQAMDACAGFCENGGECRLLAGGVPECKCTLEWTGSRCETEKRQTGDGSGNLRMTIETSMRESAKIDTGNSDGVSICGWLRWQPATLAAAAAEFMRISTSQQIRFTTSAVHFGSVSLDMKLAPFMWQQFCLVYEGGRWRVAVNGVFTSQPALITGSVRSLDGARIQLAPSLDSAASSFVGELNHIELYPRALTKDEIAQMAFDCSSFAKSVIPGEKGIAWRVLVELFAPDDVLLPPLCENALCFPGNDVCGGQKDKIPPVAVSCPSDFIVTAKPASNLTIVTWKEPTFVDNIQVTSVSSNFLPNRPFPWGEFDVVYVAADAAGNTATCTFTVFVQPFACRFNEMKPENATLTELTVVGFGTSMEASFKCTDPHYPLSVPDFFTCDYLGQWSRQYILRDLFLPSCGSTIPATKQVACAVSAVAELCDDGGTLIFEESTVALDDVITMLSDLEDCHDWCSRLSECLIKHAVTAYDFHCEVLLPSSNASQMLRLWTSAAEGEGELARLCPFGRLDVAYKCDNQDYPFPFGPDGERCLRCPLGTFGSIGSCTLCPVDTYSDEINTHDHCKACPDGFITGNQKGCNKENDCYFSCPPGQHTDEKDRTKCVDCGIGHYNDKSGQRQCPFCQHGGTRIKNATSPNDCVDICGPGMGMDENFMCHPCEQGSFKGKDDFKCLPCVQGLTTVDVKSTSASDCTLLNCMIDSYVNLSLPCSGLNPNSFVYGDHCIRCQPGTHQPAMNQTSCIPCLPGQEVQYATCSTKQLCLPNEPTCPAGSYCAKPEGQPVYSCIKGDDPSSTSSSFPWWMILLIVAGCLLIVTALVAAVYLNRKRLTPRKRFPSDVLHSTPPIATMSSAAAGNPLRIYPDEAWSNDGDKTPNSTFSTKAMMHGEQSATARHRMGITPFDFIPDGQMILLPRALLTEDEMLTGRSRNDTMITFDSKPDESHYQPSSQADRPNPLELLRQRHRRGIPALDELQQIRFTPSLSINPSYDDNDDLISFD